MKNVFFTLSLLLAISSCSPKHNPELDRLNAEVDKLNKQNTEKDEQLKEARSELDQSVKVMPKFGQIYCQRNGNEILKVKFSKDGVFNAAVLGFDGKIIESVKGNWSLPDLAQEFWSKGILIDFQKSYITVSLNYEQSTDSFSIKYIALADSFLKITPENVHVKFAFIPFDGIGVYASNKSNPPEGPLHTEYFSHCN